MTVPTTDTILRTVGRATPGRRYIEAEVGLNYIEGNRTAHWSATGWIYEPHGTWDGAAQKRNGREADLGGAIGDEIARVWPKLAPIVALHLSDTDGVPMHAEANGWYFYSDGHLAYELKNYGEDYARRHGTGRERAARILRVDEADLPEGMDADEFTEYVDAQRDRWRAESEAAYALLLTL